MIILIILLLVISAACVICVSVNVLRKYMNIFRRYHIGRWTEFSQWKAAVLLCARKWLNNPPVVPVDEHTDLLRKKTSNALQSWQTAGLVLGLLNDSSQETEAVIDTWESSCLNPDGTWKTAPNRVDFAMQGYALLKATADPMAVKPAMDELIKVIEANICSDGMISYSGGKKTPVRFVDTLGMVCPFLALYAKAYNKPEYLELAVDQIEKYRSIGFYPGTQLVCHAVDSEKKVPLSIYGWGRGTGWYLLAMLDVFLETDDICVRDKLQNWIEQAADEYCIYQEPDGGFRSILQGGGQYDSSITAIMAYFYSRCSVIFGNADYKEISEKCLGKLMQYTMRDGAIDQCQGDTHGIGLFSQLYDVMPFVQGITVRTIFFEGNNEQTIKN